MDTRPLIAIFVLGVGLTSWCWGSSSDDVEGADPRAREKAIDTGLLSKPVADVDTRGMTMLEAVVEIGRKSGTCFGVVLTKRSIAVDKAPAIRTANTPLGSLLSKLLGTNRGLEVAERVGCVVIRPVGEEPKYLGTIIPLFQIPSEPLDIASAALDQALSATREKPQAHQGAWGTASSISANADSPVVGPLTIKSQSVEAILSTLAASARSTMWVANPAQSSQPWTFIRYGESTETTRSKLARVLASLSE
ncbi:MAG TPA: hypothetical protein VH325_15245 [Bryobacteraceae bacterium]|jgi:hypothetical protein|nr:hypothetical protein [Bryobacteraceae bacterium]